MDEKISRRDLIKKSVRAGLVVGTAGYKLFSSKSIDDIISRQRQT